MNELKKLTKDELIERLKTQEDNYMALNTQYNQLIDKHFDMKLQLSNQSSKIESLQDELDTYKNGWKFKESIQNEAKLDVYEIITDKLIKRRR